MSDNIDTNNNNTNDYYIYVDGYTPGLNAINVKPEILVNDLSTHQITTIDNSFLMQIQIQYNKVVSLFIVIIIISFVFLIYFFSR